MSLACITKSGRAGSNREEEKQHEKDINLISTLVVGRRKEGSALSNRASSFSGGRDSE